MKAPFDMHIHGVLYAEGATIPKDLARTAKVLVQVAESVGRVHPGPGCYCDACNMTDGEEL